MLPRVFKLYPARIKPHEPLCLFVTGGVILTVCYFALTHWTTGSSYKHPLRFSLECSLPPLNLSTPKLSYSPECVQDSKATTSKRIVIIGAGPTGLGAAYRLFELGLDSQSIEVVVLEAATEAGGLASSYRDSKGFLWDNGGHVVFSHYPYFDKVLKLAVKDWNQRSRASYAYMMGSSGTRRFIPYPVQHNIHVMDKEEQLVCLKGLENINHDLTKRKPKNFDDWLLVNFGEGLSEVFMRKYNRKVWTVDPTEMNKDWVGERVAVPDVEEIKSKIAAADSSNRKNAKDSNWGPNQVFEFPVHGGTGGIWKSVAGLIPQRLFRFNHAVVKVLSEDKLVRVVPADGLEYSLTYDHLITTMPLDTLFSIIEDKDTELPGLKQTSTKFINSHTHVIGIGLKGQAPPSLSDKSWIYFPDSDSPFYRVTVFSSYADDNVPAPGSVWSLMCEAAEPKTTKDPSKWTEASLIKETIDALVTYGFISAEQVISTYHRRLERGYPVPFLKREKYLEMLQPWLQSREIYSRGRFGGWRYEVSNQDHSFMQGVEVADLILYGVPEETYPDASLVNAMKASNRIISDYEFVIAHFNENLKWAYPYAKHATVYHKGCKMNPIKRFKNWEVLPNVGREGNTYLYHIIKNYHCLAEVTVFLQGDPNPYDHSGYVYEDLNRYIEEGRERGYSVSKTNYFFNWGHISNKQAKWAARAEKGLSRDSKLTLGEFWEAIFGTPHPFVCTVSYGGMFAVRRDRILSHPKCFYENIMSFLDDHVDPEEGHYLERMWTAIFS